MVSSSLPPTPYCAPFIAPRRRGADTVTVHLPIRSCDWIWTFNRLQGRDAAFSTRLPFVGLGEFVLRSFRLGRQRGFFRCQLMKTTCKPECSLLELQALANRGVPTDFFLAPLLPSPGRVPPLFDTSRQLEYSFARRHRHLHSIVPIQLQRLRSRVPRLV